MDDDEGWWAEHVHPGGPALLLVYGDRMDATVETATGTALRLRIPLPAQVAALQLPSVQGLVEVAVPEGIVKVQGLCWSHHDLIRIQVLGPAQFIQRREHRRVPLRTPVTLVWLQAEVGTWGRALSHTVDVSLGGLAVEPATTVWPDTGAEILLCLQLDGHDLQVRAEVIAKTRDYGLRLRFVDLAPDAYDRIQRLMTPP